MIAASAPVRQSACALRASARQPSLASRHNHLCWLAEPKLAKRAKAGGGGGSRTCEAMRRLISSQLPLPLGTLPRSTAAQSGRTLPADRRRPWRRENRDSPDVGRGGGRARLWGKRWGKVNQGEQLKSPPWAPKLPYSGTHDTSKPMKDRKFIPKGPRGGAKPFNRPGKSAGRPAWRDRDSQVDGPVILYGWHTVTMALANPQRQIRKLTLTENAARRLADENIETRIAPEIVRPQEIDRLLSPDAVHQGLLAEADPLPSPDIETLAQEGMVLVLDQITDPHNVGAILRSAAAFAVKAIVTTARHSPEATGVLAKAASGALELVPMITVQNLARALNELNDSGFQTVGLDSEGSEDLSDVALREPLALVLGAEGKGLRQLTRETCSVVARLDMPGEIKSLNVSNAAVLSLYVGASRLGLMKR